jgi:hypothetical protein
MTGADPLPRGLLQYNARFARVIDQEFLEIRRFFVQFRQSCLRAGIRGDFSKPDGLSATIPQDLCAACISQSPDSTAWHEPRLGMKLTICARGQPKPAPCDDGNAPILFYPRPRLDDIRRTTYFRGGSSITTISRSLRRPEAAYHPQRPATGRTESAGI